MKQGEQSGPLNGVLVVDLTRVLAGPFATMVLSDLGAHIIKVEPPGGDDARHFGPFIDGKSAYFESLNRGKESIALDLKTPADRALFKKLVARADILVENYRAGTMEKLKLGWDVLQTINPRLIYASVSGFGHTGPYRNLPAYDLVVQAMGGIMSITGHEGGSPVRVGTSIGDLSAGLFGLGGILAALYQRERNGCGCKVDIGMLDCQIAMLENAIGRYLTSGENPKPLGMRHPSITPFDGFKVGDEYLIIAAGNDAIFKNLCTALGLGELATDVQFASNPKRTENHHILKQKIESALSNKSVAQWQSVLQRVGVPCAPINSIQQVVDDAQINARNMIIESVDEQGARMRIGGNPIKFSMPMIQKLVAAHRH